MPINKNNDLKPASSTSLLGQSGDIHHWVFDLDNTLYSADSHLFDQIDRRMGDFIASLLDLEYLAARKIQKDYFHTYGTTLRGLMLHHKVEPKTFLDFVHDIDLSVIPENAALINALDGLEGDCVIFTNASRDHAEQIVEHLGITRFFDGIFDICDADYLPKPEMETYDRFIKTHAIDPARAILFEDTAANLKPADQLGMTTVLVTPGEDGVTNETNADHIHHITDDLAHWLTKQTNAPQMPNPGAKVD